MDWPSATLPPLVTIHPWSQEAIGEALNAMGEQWATLSGSSAVYQTANKALYVPFRVDVPITVVKMFTHNGAAASGNIDVGIYTSEAQLIVSSGSTAMAGTAAIQAFDITDTLLVPGSYLMAMACDNTTAAFARQQLSAASAAFGILSQLTAFPLPSPATPARDTGAYLPLFGLTTRTVV